MSPWGRKDASLHLRGSPGREPAGGDGDAGSHTAGEDEPFKAGQRAMLEAELARKKPRGTVVKGLRGLIGVGVWVEIVAGVEGASRRRREG